MSKRTLKGGYQIVDLQNIDLLGENLKIDGIHAKIESANRKAIMLTGIVIDEVEKHAVYVIPVVDSGSYVLKGIYGKDITINADDTIVVENASGGAVTRQAIVDATGLVTPLQPPLEGTHELVGIDDANAQEKIKISAGLKVENGELKATGTKLYLHTISVSGMSISGTIKFISNKQNAYTSLNEIANDNGMCINFLGIKWDNNKLVVAGISRGSSGLATSYYEYDTLVEDVVTEY